MGAEPEDGSIGPGVTAVATRVTTTTTTTTIEATSGGDGSPSTFGSYFLSVFGGGGTAAPAPAEKAVDGKATGETEDEKANTGIHAKRGTALRALQDAYDKAEVVMGAAHAALERAGGDLRTAQERHETAKKSGVPGASTVTDAALTQAKSKYEGATIEFEKASKALDSATKAKRQAEVALAESVKARQVREALFGQKGKTAGYDLADDIEAKRLAAVVKLQRAWRRYIERKKQSKPGALWRKIALRVFSRETTLALFMAFLIFASSLFSESSSSSRAMEVIRTFSALDHGYLSRGVVSGTVTAELTVMRARHDKVLVNAEECESSLQALRKPESGFGSMRSPLANSCGFKLREVEKELAQLKKNSEVEASIAVDKRIKLLQAELALAKHEIDVQKIRHEEELAYVRLVHEAESEKLMALAQANIMDAKHEGARLLRKLQVEGEATQDELEALRDKLTVCDRARKGDPPSVDALVKKHDDVVKNLKRKHAAAVKAIDDEHRARLSETKAENVRMKVEDVKSLELLKEKHAAVQKILEEKISLANEQATAAKGQVCKTKSSALTLLVYPLIAAVGLLLGVVANADHRPVSSRSRRTSETLTKSEQTSDVTSAEPAVGVPICKRCEAAETLAKSLQSRAEFAEDSNANLRKEIKTLQDDNLRVNKRLRQQLSERPTKSSQPNEDDGELHRLEEENIKLSARLHDAQARALEITEQREMLTLRVDTLQKKLIEEGATIKELSDKLIRAEKENFELRQIIDEARAETRIAERKLEDAARTLDTSGKERGGLQVELDAVNKRLREAAAQLTKASLSEQQKDAKIEAILLAKEDVERQLAVANEDLAVLQERVTVGERQKAQLQAQNAELQAQQRRSKSMHETQIAQLQKRLQEVEAERDNLSKEQERLLEEVVSKQEEIDQLLQHIVQLQQSDDQLGKELTDLVKINEAMRARLEEQDALLVKSREKDLIIVEQEAAIEEWTSRFEQHKSKLKACELSREEGQVLLRNRDQQIAFLEEELQAVRNLHEGNSNRLNEQLKRLGELEMDAGRKLAAKEAAEAQLEQSEAAARKTIARLEQEIADLQNRLAAEKASNESLRAVDDINASKLRQESRLLQDKTAELKAAEVEKGQLAEEIARLEKELEELRRRLAELMAELADLKITKSTITTVQVAVETEERQALVYDEAADILRGLRQISLFNLLYAVSFAKVRDVRQWRALTIAALSHAERPIQIKRKRDDLFYAKKRAARILVGLAQTPHVHNMARSGWLESEREQLALAVGWTNAEEVWLWATRALASISRIFQGTNAHQMYMLGGLQAALDLMRQAESDVEIQLHGSRCISGLISGELAFFAQEAPQIVSGSALETLAVTLRTFPLDSRVVRAAARATWVCVHLGREFGQHTFVQHRVYEPLMFAMNCHLGDIKVVESCCGAVLAAAVHNANTQASLVEAGVRDVVRDTLQASTEVNFSGTFSDLSTWLFDE